MLTLEVTKRDTTTNVDALRTLGSMPAVVYGRKSDAQPIAINVRVFGKIWKEAGGSTIVVLSGLGEDIEVLIHDVQWDTLKHLPLHADFFVIERGKKVNVTVPIHFEGIAPAEKLGGIVTKAMHELVMDVAPRDIPQSITVDVSQLVNLSSVITIADLSLPASAEIENELTDAVASIVVAKEEEVEERTVEDVAVEGEKKGEEDTDEKSGADAKEGGK